MRQLWRIQVVKYENCSDIKSNIPDGRLKESSFLTFSVSFLKDFTNFKI